MSNRNSELQETMNRLIDKDFTKVAQAGAPMPPMGGAPMMDPMMGGGAPPMDPMMGGWAPPMMDPAMMDPAMMDPAMAGGAPPAPQESAEAEKGMKEVAMKALDMAHETIGAVLESGNLTPNQMADAAAATIASSDALHGIPAEEIAAQA